MKPRNIGLRRRLGTFGLGLGLLMGAATVAMPAASAHVGDITVTNARCVDATSMSATYKVGWTNGTSTGKLYQRSGLYGTSGNAGSGTSGWTFVKNVSGASGSDTFTITHAKTSFSGGNGPWWSSKVVFSDGYGVAADTRVEGFDWNKCGVVKDADASVSTTPPTCDSPEKLVLGQTTNATWGTPTRTTGPGNYSVTATGNAGPPQHVFSDGSSTKSFTGTLADRDTSQNCWLKDATASVTVSQPTCDAAGIASVANVKNATLVGTLDQSVGSHVATFKSDNGHLFSDGTDTLQVPYTVSGKDKSKCDIVNPVNPTVEPSRCVNGSPSTPTLSLPATTGITYTVSAQAPYSPGQTVVVTATWDENANQPANLPAGWLGTSATTATFTVKFAQPDCTVIVQPPTVPVVDECGPGNAHFGAVPAGPWTSVTNPDGSLAITANPGNTFPGGSTVTVPAPVDSNKPCPPTGPVNVKGSVKKIDKCGRAGDRFMVAKVDGGYYVVKGKIVREGVWLKPKGKVVTVKFVADSSAYQAVGKHVWKVKFAKNKPCATAPHVSPNTGMRSMV